MGEIVQLVRESATMLGSDWHLDKKVPVALIFSMTVIAVGGWITIREESARTDQRLTEIERRLDEAGAEAARMREEVSDNGATIAVLLSRIDDTNTNLNALRAEVSTTNRLLRELLGGGQIGSP